MIAGPTVVVKTRYASIAATLFNRLVLVSPNTTLLPASPGTPFQMRSVAPLTGALSAPGWYAKSCMPARRQVCPVGTVKSSASRTPPVASD
jgi:hypothetical protein